MPQLFPVVQWSVHWAPSQTTRLLVLARARCCALKTHGKNKMQAPLLGLAKSLYYSVNVHRNFFYYTDKLSHLESERPLSWRTFLQIEKNQIKPNASKKVLYTLKDNTFLNFIHNYSIILNKISNKQKYNRFMTFYST